MAALERRTVMNGKEMQKTLTPNDLDQVAGGRIVVSMQGSEKTYAVTSDYSDRVYGYCEELADAKMVAELCGTSTKIEYDASVPENVRHDY